MKHQIPNTDDTFRNEDERKMWVMLVLTSIKRFRTRYPGPSEEFVRLLVSSVTFSGRD